MTPAPSTSPLAAVDGWQVDNVAIAVFAPDGSMIDSRGAVGRPFRLASISKLLTSYSIMNAVAAGLVSLDDPAGPPGATLGHLLAHSSGLPFEGQDLAAQPGARRIYSNAGIELAAEHLSDTIGVPFEHYLHEALVAPLDMGATSLYGSPAHAVHGAVADLGSFVAELFTPTLIPAELARAATSVQFPGLVGIVPSVGRFDPCDWGYGFERNFGRRAVTGQQHWAGTRVSTEAFGHFGASGTFLWADPVHRLACICLTDRRFDAWALAAWPPLCDAVVEAYGRPAA